MINQIKERIFALFSKIIVAYKEYGWRKRLIADNFSIICSNCIGGIIYNHLGKEFLSPTINMYFTQRDFIKFAVDIKRYVNAELKFINTDDSFPVAKLDDITLYFNHSKNEKQAEDDWNRRKQRINYDNVYIILYYRDGYDIAEIREIEKSKAKKVIILTSTQIDLDYAFLIKKASDTDEAFLEKDKYGLRTFEKQWNFVDWLNG